MVFPIRALGIFVFSLLVCAVGWASERCIVAPAFDDCSSFIAMGQICWEDKTQKLFVGEGLNTVALAGPFEVISRMLNTVEVCEKTQPYGEFPLTLNAPMPKMEADAGPCSGDFAPDHGCCKRPDDTVICVDSKPLVKVPMPQEWESEPFKITCKLTTANDPIECVLTHSVPKAE